MSSIIATVAELWIYPVKSMAGISTAEAEVGLDGIEGDRRYAFVRSDQAGRNGFPWMTARQSARMLWYKPELPQVRVRTPEGSMCDVDDPALRDGLASQLGHSVFLLKCDRGTFDCQHISVFSLASLSALAAEVGCPIDRRRFRANLYVEPASGRAFEEDSWTGCLLQIGEGALIGVTKRDSRCVIVNLDPESGEQDPTVLKTIAQRHEGKVGVYANVVRPGKIRVGDEVRMVEKFQLKEERFPADVTFLA